MTRVVNIKTDTYDVYIGRGSPYGNPFKVSVFGRREALKLFREFFAEQIQRASFQRSVERLRGKVLGCHCAPNPCHGDVYVEWLRR